MRGFNIVCGVLLCVTLASCHKYYRKASDRQIARSGAYIDDNVQVNLPQQYAQFSNAYRHPHAYYVALNMHRTAWILRRNLITILGSILYSDRGTSLSSDLLTSMYKVVDGLRLRHLSTVEIVTVLPDIQFVGIQQQLLTLFRKLSEVSRNYFKSHVDSLLVALCSKVLDLEDICECLPLNVFSNIFPESLVDFKTENLWPFDVEASVSPWMESHLGKFFACTMSALDSDFIKPTNKLVTYLMLSLPLQQFDPQLSEAFHYMFDIITCTTVVTSFSAVEGIYKDPYLMVRKYLETLSRDQNENKFTVDCAKIILKSLTYPIGSSEDMKSNAITFQDCKLKADFGKIFDVITLSEFPDYVYFAKHMVLVEVVSKGRYNIDKLMSQVTLYDAQDEMDMLALVLETFVRRLPLPEPVLDRVKLIRAHVLMLQRYRKGYVTGKEHVIRGFFDVTVPLEALYGNEMSKKVSKFILQELYWLPIDWYKELKVVNPTRIAEKTATTILNIVIRKNLIRDQKVNTVIEQFLASNYISMDWKYIEAGCMIPYSSWTLRQHVPARVQLALKFSNERKANKTGTMPGYITVTVTMTVYALVVNTRQVCVDMLRFKEKNPDAAKNVIRLLDELPDLNNPQMFWTVKTFFILNYKNIFNSEFDVCRYSSHRLLLKGAMLKALGLEEVGGDEDLRSALKAYVSALDSGADRIDLNSVLFFLGEPEMKILLPKIYTTPSDLEEARTVLRKAYAFALIKKLDNIDFERFKKLEDMFIQYNKNYDLSGFYLTILDFIKTNANETYLETLVSVVQPQNVLLLLGTDFDKSLSKTPKQLLRNIITNILKSNVGTLIKQTEEALRYFLDVIDEAPSIIKLEDVPQLDQADKYLPALKLLLRWDQLRPFLHNDFAYPDQATTFDRLKYIIDYVLSTNEGKLGRMTLAVFKHFQAVLSSKEALPVINVQAIPGLVGTIEQFAVLNKALQIHNLIKFLPPDFHYTSSTPKNQLKNILENLLYFSKTKLKPKTVSVLIFFNDQLSYPTNEEIIDVSKIKEINPNDEMLATLKEILRKETVYIFIPANYRFDAWLSPKEQLLRLLKTISKSDKMIGLNPKWSDVIDHFIKILDSESDLDTPVILTDDINEICDGDQFLPTLREILKPKLLWKLIDINYKANAKNSPKTQLKNIIDNILKVSVDKLTKIQFDSLNHFQDILEYNEECHYLPPIVNVTFVPQIDPLDENVQILYVILRADVLLKLVSSDFEIHTWDEPQYLLKRIIDNILVTSLYKLKPKWSNVLFHFKLILKTEINVVIKTPQLEKEPNLDVVVDILKTRPQILNTDLDDMHFGKTNIRVEKILSVIIRKIKLKGPKYPERLKVLIDALKHHGNATKTGVIDTDGITGIYITNPQFPALNAILHNPDLVNTLSPNFVSFKVLNPYGQLIFLFRDILNTNSIKLTKDLRNTIQYFYNLLTETADKLQGSIFQPRDIDRLLSTIQSIQTDTLLPALKLIILNPNLKSIYKPVTLYDTEKPNQILLYIINSISINYPDLEMVVAIKEVFDHFREIFAREPPPSSAQVTQVNSPPQESNVHLLNMTGFSIELAIHIQSIAKPPETELLIAILNKPNILDLLGVSVNQMYTNSPRENIVYILNCIKANMNLMESLLSASSLATLNVLFSRFPESVGVVAPAVTMPGPITASKIPNKVQQEINNVIDVFVNVPMKELLTVAMQIVNITELMNLSISSITESRPDQKLYYFVSKMHQHINNVVVFFPGQNIVSVVQHVLYHFNPSNEWSKTDISVVKEAINASLLYFERHYDSTKNKDLISVLKFPCLGLILSLDKAVLQDNNSKENLIYILKMIEKNIDILSPFFPGMDLKAELKKINTPAVEPIWFQSVVAELTKFDRPEAIETLKQIKNVPDMEIILNLNASIMNSNSPLENMVYVFSKVKEHIVEMSAYLPRKDLESAVASVLIEDGRPVSILYFEISKQIEILHKNTTEAKILIEITKIPDIEIKINLNIPLMKHMSPLENMVYFFLNVQLNIRDVSAAVGNKDLANAVAAILKIDDKPASTVLIPIKYQIEKIVSYLPDRELLLQTIDIADKAIMTKLNLAIMKYNSPLENTIYFFEKVKENIQVVSSFLPGTNLGNAVETFCKLDEHFLEVSLAQIKHQVEFWFGKHQKVDSIKQIINTKVAKYEIRLDLVLMKFNSPLVNMIQFFKRVKIKITNVIEYFPDTDVEGLVKIVLKEDGEKFAELIRHVQNKIETLFGTHPQKEVLLSLTKLQDIEIIISIDISMMRYYSPLKNMVYFYECVQADILKVTDIFPGVNIQTALNVVLQKDGMVPAVILFSISKQIEITFNKHPNLELLLEIVSIPEIEFDSHLDIPLMNYQSPLENMIYFFTRVKDNVEKLSLKYPKKDFEKAIKIVLKEEENTWSTIMSTIRNQIELFSSSQDEKKVLIEITKIPHIDKEIKLDITIMKYNPPLENTLYFLEKVKDVENGVTSFMNYNKHVKKAISFALKENYNLSETFFKPISQQIETIYKYHPKKDLMLKITKIPDINVAINLDIPITKYKPPLENMIYFFQNVKQNLGQVSQYLPNEDIKSVIDFVLKEEVPTMETVMTPITQQLMTFYVNSPHKELMKQLVNIPDIVQKLHLNTDLMKYNSPLENMIYFFQKVKDNIKTTDFALMPVRDVEMLVQTVLKEDMKAIELTKTIKREIDTFFFKDSRQEILTKIVSVENIDKEIGLNYAIMKYQLPLENMIYFFKCVQENIAKVSNYVPENNIAAAISAVLAENDTYTATFSVPITRKIETIYYYHPDKELLMEIVKTPDICSEIKLDLNLMKYHSPIENMVYTFQKVKENIDKVTMFQIPRKDVEKAISFVFSEDVNMGTIIQPVLHQVERFFYKRPVMNSVIQILSIPDIEKIIGLNIHVMKYQTPLENLMYTFQNVKRNEEKIQTYVPGINVKHATTTILKDELTSQTTLSKLVNVMQDEISLQVTKYFNKHPKMEIISQIVNHIPKMDKTVNLDIPLMSYYTGLEKMIHFFQKVDENVEIVSKWLPADDLEDALVVVLKQDVGVESSVLTSVAQCVETLYGHHPAKEPLLQMTKIPNIEQIMHVNIPMMKYNSPIENMIYFYKNIKEHSKTLSQYLPESTIQGVVSVVLEENKAPLSTIMSSVQEQITTLCRNQSAQELLLQITQFKDIEQELMLNVHLMNYKSPRENMIYILEAVKDNLAKMSGIFPGKDIKSALVTVFKEKELQAENFLTPVIQEVVRIFRYDPHKEQMLKLLKTPNIENVISLNLHLMQYNSPKENLIYFFQMVKDNSKEIKTILPDLNLKSTIMTVLKNDETPIEMVFAPIIQQISKFSIAKPVKELLIQIAKSPNICNLINIKTNIMSYKSPFENTIYFFQTVRENIAKVSAVFPDKDLKPGLASVLKDNVPLPSLMTTVCDKIDKLFSTRPEKVALLQITKIKDIDIEINLDIPLMKYKSPLENMVYFFTKVQENSLQISTMLPETNVPSALEIIINDSEKQRFIVFSKILQQINMIYSNHTSKEVMTEIVNIPNIDTELNLCISLMGLQSPLENMVYVFKQVQEEINKVTTYFPGPGVQIATSTVLKEDEDTLSLSIYLPIIDSIQTFYEYRPELAPLTKIVYMPDAKEILGLNIPLMKYFSPVEKMIYFFEKVEENLQKVSEMYPATNVKNLTAIILKQNNEPISTLIKPVLDLVDTLCVAGPSKDILAQILNMPEIVIKLGLNLPLMHYNRPHQNMIYIFQKVKENLNEISAYFSGTDLQNVVTFFLSKAVQNMTVIFSDQSVMSADIISCITQRVQTLFYNKPEHKLLIELFKIKDIEAILGLNITMMNTSKPLENMIYFFQKVKDNVEHMSQFAASSDLNKALNLLKEDELLKLQGVSGILSTIEGQIQKYHDKQPYTNLLIAITKLSDVKKILDLNIALMKYLSPLENCLYFFQKVKDNIGAVSAFFPGKNIQQAIAAVLKEEVTPELTNTVSVIPPVVETITKYFEEDTKFELLINITKIPGIEDFLKEHIPIMKYTPPLENMIIFFQAVKDNIGIVSKYFPRDDVTKCVAMVLNEDIQEKLFSWYKPNYILLQIQETIKEYFYNAPEEELLLQLVNKPDVEFEIHLKMSLMIYQSPLENMIYYFGKVKDSLGLISEYFEGKNITPIIASVLKEDKGDILYSNIFLSATQYVEETYFNHPLKDLIVNILNNKAIAECAKLNVALMKYGSPLENVVYFFQQVKDNLEQASMLFPKVDLLRVISIVLGEDIKSITRNNVLEPIIQLIHEYFNENPKEDFYIQMVNIPGIEYKIKLNIALMTYNCPLENLMYFFQKVKENLPTLSLVLPIGDLNNAVSTILREDEVLKKTEYLFKLIMIQIEKQNYETADKTLMMQIFKAPNVVQEIHLCVPLMKYQPPLKNFIYFYEKVVENAYTIQSYVSTTDVSKINLMVLKHGDKNETFHRPLCEIFPITQQIEKYTTNPSDKELLIQILNIPKIEKKIYLSLPFMMYNCPLENMIYIFRNVEENIRKVSSFFPGKEIELIVKRLLTRDVITDDNDRIKTVDYAIKYEISKYVANPDDKAVLLEIVNIPDIEHKIHLSLDLMQYKTPLENMIYFYQRAQENIEAISGSIPSNNLKSALSMILKDQEPLSSHIFLPIINKTECYFKQTTHEERLNQIAKIPNIHILLNLNEPLIKYQTPLQNMLYLYANVRDNIAKVSALIPNIPNNELQETLFVVLKENEPVEVSLSAIRSQIEFYFPNAADKAILIEITKILNVELQLNLNVPLMKYSSPVENMVYLFQMVKEDVIKISGVLPISEVKSACAQVIHDSDELTSTSWRPISQQIDLIFYHKKEVKKVFIQIKKIPLIGTKLLLNVPLLSYLTPLEAMIYLFENVKENSYKLYSFVPRNDLDRVVSIVLKEDEPVTSLLSPVEEQIQVYCKYTQDKETAIQITNLPDVVNKLTLNVHVLKYLSPLEKFIYFFQKVKENLNRVYTLLPGKDIKNTVAAILKENEDISTCVYLPILKQIKVLFKPNAERNILLQIMSIPDKDRILGLNIALMKYQSPLENMVYLFQMVKCNVEAVSSKLPGMDINNPLSIVLNVESESSIKLVEQQIESIYCEAPQKDLMIEIINIPYIELVIGASLGVMKHNTPLENLVYLFKKVKDNIDKIYAVLPGRDIQECVDIILRETENVQLTVILKMIVQKMESIFDRHPSKSVLIQATQIPDIEYLVNLDINLMRYYSPLRNMIYLFQKIDVCIDKVSAVYPTNYITEALTIILMNNEDKAERLLVQVREQVQIFFKEHKEYKILNQMTQLPTKQNLPILNLPLMRYQSPLENMIYFYQSVNDQRNKISMFFPGTNISTVAGVALKDDWRLPSMMLSSVVQQVDVWHGQSPDWNLLFQITQTPDIKDKIYLNIPLMKYQSPLENMIYFFQNMKDNIDKMMVCYPGPDYEKAVEITLNYEVNIISKYKHKEPEESINHIIHQIERYFKSPEKEILINIMNIPDIEYLIGLNVPFMRYNCPLENMAYVFSKIQDNVDKITSFFYNTNIYHIVTNVLKESRYPIINGSSTMSVFKVFNPIREVIESSIGDNPEKNLLIEITNIPSVEKLTFLNIPAMLYTSPLENTMIFFQNVKHNVEMVSSFVPGKNVQQAISQALKEGGPPAALLILPLVGHVEQFYAQYPNKYVFIQILKTPKIECEIKANIPFMRYQSELDNLIYFFEKVKDISDDFNATFPNNQAGTSIEVFLDLAYKYVASKIVSPKPSDHPLINIYLSICLPQILQQINMFFNSSSEKDLLKIIANLPDIQIILGLNITQMKMNIHSPFENLKYFMTKIAGNIDRLAQCFSDSSTMKYVMNALNLFNSTHTMREYIAEVPDKPAMINIVESRIPDDVKEWIISVLNVNNIVGVLNLSISIMQNQTALDNLKYILTKAQNNITQLSIYYPGKNMLPVITAALDALESKPGQGGTTTTLPQNVENNSSLPSIYSELPEIFDAMVKTIPKNVSQTSILMFVNLVKRKDFALKLNIPPNVVSSFTPRKLLELIIDCTLNTPDIMADTVFQHSIKEIAAYLGVGSISADALATPSLNMTEIMKFVPSEIGSLEKTILYDFLTKPDLFSTLNIVGGVNEFQYKYSSPFKQLKAILYKAENTPSLPPELIKIVIKVLNIINSLSEENLQDADSILKITLSLPDSVATTDVVTVTTFLKTKGLLHQIGFKTDRKDFSSDNDYAFAVLNACTPISSVTSNEPLYQSILAVMEGLKQGRCVLFPRKCMREQNIFNRIKEILRINDTISKSLFDILFDCNVMDLFDNNMGISNMRKVFLSIYESTIIQHNAKYVSIVKDILIKLGVDPVNTKIDVNALILLIPMTIKHYSQVVDLFRNVDINRLIGPSLNPSAIKSQTYLLVRIVEILLVQIVNKENVALYEGLNDLLLRLKPLVVIDYDLLITQIVEYLPNVGDRWIVQEFLIKNDMSELLGPGFDIELNEKEPKLKLLILLKNCLDVPAVAVNVKLFTSIKVCINALEGEGVVENQKVNSFIKLLIVVEAYQKSEHYLKLKEFLSRNDLWLLLGKDFSKRVSGSTSSKETLRVLIEMSLMLMLYGEDRPLRDALSFFLTVLQENTQEQVTQEVTQTIKITQTVDLNEVFNALDIDRAMNDPEDINAIKQVFDFFKPDSTFSADVFFKGFDINEYKSSNGVFLRAFFKHLGNMSDDYVSPMMKAALIRVFPYITLTGPGAVPVDTQETTVTTIN